MYEAHIGDEENGNVVDIAQLEHQEPAEEVRLRLRLPFGAPGGRGRCGLWAFLAPQGVRGPPWTTRSLGWGHAGRCRPGVAAVPQKHVPSTTMPLSADVAAETPLRMHVHRKRVTCCGGW